MTDTVRTALADHGAEMLPEQVEAWLLWIPGNVCIHYGGPGRGTPTDEPFGEFLPHHWCHLLLLAHQLAPSGPDSIGGEFADEVVTELERWYVLEGPRADEYSHLLDDEDDDETYVVVLPLAVFTKGLAMLATASASSNTLAYLEAQGDPRMRLVEAAEGPTDPVITECMAVDMQLRQLVMVATAAAMNIRDTAGDIEVVDGLVERMADLLQQFAGLELVRELAEAPREPEFLGPIGVLASQCVATAVTLFDELEVAELA